ncbi:MAG: voltage-gated potassium channel [Solirubrobacteraceae bacterium]|nr:voltage-gated potassium channel [Solirubrobacteraceae bacterium]
MLGLAIAGLLAAGTIGFSLTEGESVWDAFVRTLDTVATTGSIPGANDTGGQIVKVVLTLLGVGTLFYALVTVTELFVSGHLGQLLAERRERRMTASLSDHYIICGFGRVGQQVARDLRAGGVRYVVIDHEPGNREYVEVGVRFMFGRSSDEEMLREAGIDRARAVLACVDSDAENIFICLTARELRPDIAIVARASHEDSERKLRRAGADRVISPYKSSGHEMARLALHPNVFGAREVADEYRLEEVEVSPGSPGEASTVDEVRGAALIVGVRRVDGTFHPQPPPDARLRAGDVVMAMGTPEDLARVEENLAPVAS